MRRIERIWKKYNIIDDAQHAYTSGSNTDCAISQLHAAMETSKNQYGIIVMGSWDYKKAFDSPAKSILILAWTRAGIPRKFAEYIVGMDSGGKIIVKTEYAQSLLKKKGYKGLVNMGEDERKNQYFNRNTNEYEEFKKYFAAVMGCGQGDNPSSLNWKAFIDILNRAILLKTGIKPFYIRDIYGRLWRIKPIVFADDVRNQTVDGEDLQKEADILCAFCFIFGLRLNRNKTEMFIKNYGGEKDITEIREISLRLMDEKEKVVVTRMIMLQQDGKDKHLGITHDNERIGASTLKK